MDINSAEAKRRISDFTLQAEIIGNLIADIRTRVEQFDADVRSGRVKGKDATRLLVLRIQKYADGKSKLKEAYDKLKVIFNEIMHLDLTGKEVMRFKAQLQLDYNAIYNIYYNRLSLIPFAVSYPHILHSIRTTTDSFVAQSRKREARYQALLAS